jgi:hypothetical protein
VLWNGWGSPGGTSFDPPQPPTNLIATLQNAPDRVELSWSGPASGTPEGYIVYRQHDGGAFVRLVAGLSTPTTFTDNAPLAGNLTYKVTAFAHQQEGGASDLASVTYTPPPPPAPSAPTAVVATPGQAVLVTGAAAWPLDEGTGQTVADATGLGHTGQFGTKPIADSNDPTWTTGIAGGALRFDGSNDRVLVADAPDLRFAGSFTLEAWVQRTSIGKEGCIVAKGDTGRRNFWMLFDASNRIDFRWQTPSGKDRGARTLLPFTDLGWHHVACIWDQQALQNRIYYDGILVHSAADTGTPTTSAEPMYIGAKVTSGSVKSNFHGNLDLVRVSPGALYGGPFVPQTNFDLSPQPVVQVAWAPPLLGIATGYNVYREQPDSTFALMTPIPVTAMSWQDTAPPSGGACYRVSAIDAWAHEGDLSDVACAGLLAAKSAPVESETHSPPAADLQVSVGPNPFNPTTTIHFRLASAGPVRCSVYDVRGTRVAVLLDGSRPAGQNVLTWNADRVASGTYFLVVQADGLQEKRKLVLLK